jgi:ornithine decarboxylase
MLESENIRAALASLSEDKILFDLAGIEERYDWLTRELPGVSVRFAMKSCPVDEVLACLTKMGAGFDAASPSEIKQAIRSGAPASMVHYGNTIKSDRNIVQAYRFGIRDFATDSVEDVRAIAAHAPGSRIFCRLANNGDGALWGLGRKCGCSPADAISVLETARALGLSPSGLSVHVGSQQMTATAWRDAFDSLAHVIAAAGRRGIFLDYVNLGGGLPALGYFDEQGRPLIPPIDQIFATMRAGIEQLRRVSRTALDFIVELYLSCGRFNGLYEMDRVQYRLVFPSHEGAERVPAVIAGPTCDSEDAYGTHRSLVQVPRAAASGDPVWILSCGAYSVSYTTLGFNGFSPLPRALIRGERVGAEGLAR